MKIVINAENINFQQEIAEEKEKNKTI